MTNLEAFIYTKNPALYDSSIDEIRKIADSFLLGIRFFLDNIMNEEMSTKDICVESAKISFPDSRREFFRYLNLILTSNENAPMISNMIDIFGRKEIKDLILNTQFAPDRSSSRYLFDTLK